MKALITGASSGLGKDFAVHLSNMGYDLVLTARHTDILNELAKTLKTNVTVIGADLSSVESCIKLFDEVCDSGIDLIINNAGFGDCGLFEQTDLNRDISMINLNITAVSVLTKLFYKQFSEKNSGYILNVASIAGIMPGGPYMAQYYATKAYVLSLTRSLYTEAKITGKNVHLSVLCPGPVDTEFNKNANVSFALKGANSKAVTKYALNRMFKGKLTIIPGVKIKLAAFGAKFAPIKFVLKIAAKIQKSKLYK